MDSPEQIISERGLVGWREWKLLKPHFLGSLNGNALWMPGEKITAECEGKTDYSVDPPVTTKHSEDVPVKECSCGIYAHKQEQQINLYSSDLWGEVYMWGKVQDYTEGYRAQYAYPKRLFVTEKYRDMVPILSGAYGVPIEIRERPRPVRPTPKEKKAFKILNPECKVSPPTPAQFLEYHPGYRRFYELCAEYDIRTSYDDSISKGLGRSVKVFDVFDGTEDVLLKLMKCADRTTVSYMTASRGSRPKPYRFHFFTIRAPFHPLYNTFKEVTV